MKEYIYQDPDDVAAWECVCGNETEGHGFSPCDSAGNVIEPSAGGDWNDLYVCGKCGRIIDQDTLEVVGRKPDAALV